MEQKYTKNQNHSPGLENPAPKKDQGKPKILSFSELINIEFPEIPWDVEGMIESGTVNMISAPPNQYKSWVVQHMAFCLAQGVEVFGKLRTKQQKVLIVNEEDNLRMLKQRSLMMLGNQVEELGTYFLVGSGFKVDMVSVVDILFAAEDRGATFVIFDSLRSVHDANENDSQEMQQIMDCFKMLAREGVTVFFTHHNRKKAHGKYKDDYGEESRGSTAINASIQGHLSCEEVIREDGKYLIIAQRKLKCDKKMEPFLVKIDVDPEADKINFEYAGEHDSREDAFKKNKETVLSVIGKCTGWVCKKEIAALVKLGESALSKVLQMLEAEGLVESKTKKEVEALGGEVNVLDSKHNTKFYSTREKVCLDDKIDFDQQEMDF